MTDHASLGRQFLLAIFLTLHSSPSWTQETADPSLDRFKQVLEVSRDEAALKKYLQRVPPKEPAQALKTSSAPRVEDMDRAKRSTSRSRRAG